MSNVISEKQQKTTLRGKKGKKETVKNVLASPYTHYWPLINNEDDNSLKQILKSNLPKIKPQVKIPWKDIKNIPKGERREFRKKKLNLDIKPLNSDSKYMYFGINEVTKLLERDEAISVLLSHDVTPQLMIKHVVDLCVLKQVPILIVSNLKEYLRETVGISSAAFAFKKTIPNDSKLLLTHKAIVKVYTNFPVPEKHAYYPKIEKKFFVSSKDVTVEEVKIVEEEPAKNIYLYKDPMKNERIFVPKDSNESRKRKADVIELDSSEFMSCTDDKADRSPTHVYKSLIVKRIRSNPDRNKKKLDLIKNKKKKI